MDEDWVVVLVYSRNYKTRPYHLVVEGPYTFSRARDAAKYYRDTKKYEPEKLDSRFLFAQARQMTRGLDE